MANHLRRQIREAVAAAVTGLPTTGANVFQSRVYTLQRSELPALRISPADETITADTIHYPSILNRTYRIRIEAVTRALSDAVPALVDTLDGVVKEVEVAISGMSLAGLAESIRMIEVSEPEYEAGEMPTGQVTMTFEVNYFTAENVPDVSL